MSDDRGQWQLRLLDHFALHGADGEVPLTSRKAIALVAYLALQHDRSARRDVVAALLWENADPAQARVNLRQALAAVRRLDAAGTLMPDTASDVVKLSRDVAVDTDRFAQLEAGDPAAAAALYRNDLLAGFVLRDAPAFNEWLAVAQAHWRERMVATLMRLIDRALAAGGDLNTAVSAGLRLLSIDPYNEAAHRALMRTYARQGRAALALTQYRSLSDLLRRELSVAPEAETRLLYEELRAARREAAAAEPDPAAALAAPAAAPDPAGEDRRQCIAVVDDEAALREAVATYLRLNGFDAVECAHGAALDALLAQRGIDLIVLDVTMPGEDGFSIARRIRAVQRTPIVMLTARTDLIDRVVGLELGADDYLGKPFDMRELLARVKAVLRRGA